MKEIAACPRRSNRSSESAPVVVHDRLCRANPVTSI